MIIHAVLLLGADALGAKAVNRLWLALTVLSLLVIAVLVMLVVGYCIRYRAGSTVPRLPPPARVRAVEWTWLAATLGAFLAIAAWSNIDFVAARTPPADAYSVYVVGKQWMWKLEHPGGRREIDELHVPVGEPVRLVLSSADVIHSFAIPDYRVKQDVVPGRYTSLWFTALAPGEHHLFCSQYCGAEHSGMIGKVVALPREAFARWLADRPLQEKAEGMPGTPGVPLSRGQGVFYRLGCAACHVQTGNVLAPRLDGLWGRPTRLQGDREVIVDENYIRESVLDPNARIVAGYATPSLMPSFRGAISEAELGELVEFIRSIRYGWDQTPPSSPPPSVENSGPHPGQAGGSP